MRGSGIDLNFFRQEFNLCTFLCIDRSIMAILCFCICCNRLTVDSIGDGMCEFCRWWSNCQGCGRQVQRQLLNGNLCRYCARRSNVRTALSRNVTESSLPVTERSNCFHQYITENEDLIRDAIADGARQHTSVKVSPANKFDITKFRCMFIS
mgnify:CR=1 FL=1